MESETQIDKQSQKSTNSNRSELLATIIFGIITAILTFIGIIMPIFVRGRFVATVNGNLVASSDRTCLVYIDKDSVDISSVGVFPRISNPNRYSLNDVNLTYYVYTDSLSKISYRNDYVTQELLDCIEVNNADKTIYAKSEKPGPFRYFYVKDNGVDSIRLIATHNRVKDPLLFRSKIYTKKMYYEDETNRKRNVFSNANWFLQTNEVDVADIYIFNNDSVAVFENLTQDSIHQIALSYSRRGGYRAVKKNNTITDGFERWERNPWYMNALGLLVYFIGCIAVVILFAELKKHPIDTNKNIIKAIGIALLSSVILSLTIYITSVILLTTPLSLWSLLTIFVVLFVIQLSYLIIRVANERTNEVDSKWFKTQIPTLIAFLVVYIAFLFVIYFISHQ